MDDLDRVAFELVTELPSRPLRASLVLQLDSPPGDSSPIVGVSGSQGELQVEDVPWRARSAALEALASLMRLDKVPVERVWRPADWPVWNHVIVGAIRFWSRADGIDEDVMTLLTQQRFGELTDVGPPNRERYLEQLRVERNASQRHLHHVLDRYHDREWQRAAPFLHDVPRGSSVVGSGCVRRVG